MRLFIAIVVAIPVLNSCPAFVGSDVSIGRSSSNTVVAFSCSKLVGVVCSTVMNKGDCVSSPSVGLGNSVVNWVEVVNSDVESMSTFWTGGFVAVDSISGPIHNV